MHPADRTDDLGARVIDIDDLALTDQPGQLPSAKPTGKRAALITSRLGLDNGTTSDLQGTDPHASDHLCPSVLESAT